MERPPTAGWTAAHSRPGTAAGSQLSKTPRTPAATPPGPRLATPRTRAEALKPGRRGDPKPGRWPGDHTSGYRGLQPAQRGRKTVLGSSAGREVEPASTGRSRRPKPGATAPYHGTLLSPRRRLTRTEPANYKPAHPTWSPRPGSDFRTNVPGDDPSTGARWNIRVTQPPPSPGPKARATKNYDLRAYPFVTRNDAQLSYKA